MSHFYKNHYENRGKCPERRSISVVRTQVWLDQRLHQLVESSDWSWLKTGAKNEFDTKNQQEILITEIIKLEQRARGLIRDKAASPDGLQAIYDDELTSLAEQFNILRSRLTIIQQEKARAEQRSATLAAGYNELIEISIDKFWHQEETRINQLLHMILGTND